jgi:hypothetical protein
MASTNHIDACVYATEALMQNLWSTGDGPMTLYERCKRVAQIIAMETAYKGENEFQHKNNIEVEASYIAQEAMKRLVQTHVEQWLTAANKTAMMNRYAQAQLAKEAGQS